MFAVIRARGEGPLSVPFVNNARRAFQIGIEFTRNGLQGAIQRIRNPGRSKWPLQLSTAPMIMSRASRVNAAQAGVEGAPGYATPSISASPRRLESIERFVSGKMNIGGRGTVIENFSNHNVSGRKQTLKWNPLRSPDRHPSCSRHSRRMD
jgi:hypothetical protein